MTHIQWSLVAWLSLFLSSMRIPCQNGDKQKRRHTFNGFNLNGDNGIPKRRQSIQPKTATEGRSIMRGVKRYFREPWLGFYFYCEPWIVSYFLREPWIDLPLFSLWFVNWVLFSSWTVNWNPLFSLWFVIDLFFREPWILLIIFVNFPIPPQKSMSFIVMIRNWFLMIDIGLLFSEMWRRLATISYLKLNYESWHNACTSDFKRDYTRV